MYNQRDKLRCIVAGALREADMVIDNKVCYLLSNDITDRLIEGGVTIPPVTIGQTVYRVLESRPGIYNRNTKGHRPPKRCIREYKVTRNNFLNMCEDYGISVFPTYKEADNNIKERIKQYESNN